LGLIALSIVGVLAISPAVLGTSAVRASQEAARSGHLEQALDDARKAQEWQPYAATPHLQEALVLELLAAGAPEAEATADLESAVAAATEATHDEPTNWRNWLILSRIEQKRGADEAAAAAYEKARSLNPRSPLFANG
jgi:Flp pilus assembly protein TadD